MSRCSAAGSSPTTPGHARPTHGQDARLEEALGHGGKVGDRRRLAVPPTASRPRRGPVRRGDGRGRARPALCAVRGAVGAAQRRGRGDPRPAHPGRRRRLRRAGRAAAARPGRPGRAPPAVRDADRRRRDGGPARGPGRRRGPGPADQPGRPVRPADRVRRPLRARRGRAAREPPLGRDHRARAGRHRDPGGRRPGRGRGPQPGNRRRGLRGHRRHDAVLGRSGRAAGRPRVRRCGAVADDRRGLHDLADPCGRALAGPAHPSRHRAPCRPAGPGPAGRGAGRDRRCRRAGRDCRRRSQQQDRAAARLDHGPARPGPQRHPAARRPARGARHRGAGLRLRGRHRAAPAGDRAGPAARARHRGRRPPAAARAGRPGAGGRRSSAPRSAGSSPSARQRSGCNPASASRPGGRSGQRPSPRWSPPCSRSSPPPLPPSGSR